MTEEQSVDPQQPVRTGVPAVDAVLDEVDGLTDQPVDGHVAVFERAHEQLRRALDGAPQPDGRG